MYMSVVSSGTLWSPSLREPLRSLFSGCVSQQSVIILTLVNMYLLTFDAFGSLGRVSSLIHSVCGQSMR